MKYKLILLIIVAVVVGVIGHYLIGDSIPSWDWWSEGLREVSRG